MIDAGPVQLAAIAGVGALAALLNTLAGGGSLLTLPALIFLGLPADVANATNRVSVVAQSGAATLTFRRAGTLSGADVLPPLLPLAAGALLGAEISVALDEALLKKAIGLVMLLLIPLVLAPPARGLAPSRPWSGVARGAVYVAIGLYGGFLQAGVGLLLLAALHRASGLELVRANAVKSALVLGLTVPALGLFLAYGKVDPLAAASLAAGGALGGWAGGKLALRGGRRLIQAATVLAVLGSASKLLGLW